tara:strand:- start:174 stop:350 length:177 start_codon:yes stop_codon:yes gene_type:complete
MNFKILMNATGVLIIANIITQFFTGFWGDTNYPDYINSVLSIFLILFATQVFSKKNKK